VLGRRGIKADSAVVEVETPPLVQRAEHGCCCSGMAVDSSLNNIVNCS